MINSAMFTSNTAEWATPQAFFDELDAEFHFTLDPCATPQNAKCARFFTKEQDGLAQSWQGEKVYCNPPYGRDIGKWVKKAADEVSRGGADACRHAHSRENGHVVFPRLHIQASRGAVCPRTLAFQRKQMRRAVPLNGRRHAVGRGGVI